MSGRITKHRRFIIGTIVCGLIVAVMLGRMLYLQTIRHTYLYTQSENNRVRVQPIIPKRGMVYDRDHRVLITNRASYTLSLIPAEMDRNTTIGSLSRLLALSPDEVERRLRKSLVTRYQPVLIDRDIGFDKVAVLEEQNEAYPGVAYRKDQVREYIGGLGSECFTGYVGEISAEEIDNLDRTIYSAGRVIGKAGIEKTYDRDLRGLEGTDYVEVTAAGQTLGMLEDYRHVLPTPGSDMVLTIDIDIQRAADSAFGDFCCGAAVVIDPRNGEILAMVSKPPNDANIFSGVISDSLWRTILADPNNPLLNRPLNGLYPPGSTYKLVLAGATLEQGIIDRNTLLTSCVGGYRFGNRFFRCWEAGGHGRLPVVRAIEQSCDVFFYQLGYKLGLDEFYKYSQACGFGKRTGIDLPKESSGNVPSEDWYNERLGRRQWTQAVLLNLGIGQGELLVTPLQLAQFYCGLANNGKVYKPHLLRSIIGPDGRETSQGGELSFTLPFSQGTLEILKEGLIAVVNGPGGTARGSRLPNVTIAGKTGTAQNPHGEDHAWFVGFAPAERPEIVACVLVENAGHGSTYSAPPVRDIIKVYMNKYHPVDTTAIAGKID